MNSREVGTTGESVSKFSLRYLCSENPPGRFELFFKGNLLVFAGYIIATIETLLAIKFGLTELTFVRTFFISGIVLLLTIILTIITYISRVRFVWQEITIFFLYLTTFLIAFCIWVFWLGEIRFLGILNGFTAVTIVLSYTSAVQSLGMSVSTLTCYTSVVWYSIKIAGQPGSLSREIFFALCLLPAFILISMAAYYMNRRRKELQNASRELELLNSNLIDANEQLQGKQQMTEIEMELASEIQGAIFPSMAPFTTNWEVAFFKKPYGAVSGDFYDFYHRGDTLDGIAIFDVSGHGVAPALITILARPVLYSLFKKYEGYPLGKVVSEANAEMIKELEEVNLYITGIMMRFYGEEVEYLNAGHPDPILFKVSSGEAEFIDDPEMKFKGRPIGILRGNENFESLKFRVEKGDCLVLYSDGLIESRNCAFEQYGAERLLDNISAFTGGSANAMLQHITGSLIDFTCDARPSDDITVMVIKKL